MRCSLALTEIGLESPDRARSHYTGQRGVQRIVIAVPVCAQTVLNTGRFRPELVQRRFTDFRPDTAFEGTQLVVLYFRSRSSSIVGGRFVPKRVGRWRIISGS